MSSARSGVDARAHSGADDPSGLIASQVLQSDITSTNQAITNSQQANELIATADSAILDQCGAWANLAAVALTVTAIALDALDGHLARKKKMATPRRGDTPLTQSRGKNRAM